MNWEEELEKAAENDLCQRTEAVIRKVGSQWCIFSKTSGKNLGCFSSRKKALKRLREIEFFKNRDKK